MKILLFIILLFVELPSVYALDGNYSPFSDAEMKRVKATQIKNAPHTKIIADATYTEDGNCVFRISIEGTPILRETGNNWMMNTKTIVADIDGNGLADVIKEIYPGTQGLGLGCSLLIFSQYERGKFSRIFLPSERFSPEDISDFDEDSKKEIVTCVLVECEDDKNKAMHSYWVYRCWKLSGTKLVCTDAQHGFPRSIHFTNKPNHERIKLDLLKKIMVNYPTITTEGTIINNIER